MWISSRPYGTFSDQGGLFIPIVLLSATLLGWALLAVPSFVLAVWSIWRGKAQERTIASIIILLVVFALLYSFAIFFAAHP
jgi:hypothetical protein